MRNLTEITFPMCGLCKASLEENGCGLTILSHSAKTIFQQLAKPDMRDVSVVHA